MSPRPQLEPLAQALEEFLPLRPSARNGGSAPTDALRSHTRRDARRLRHPPRPASRKHIPGRRLLWMPLDSHDD